MPQQPRAMRSSPKSRWPFSRRRAAALRHCIACGDPIVATDDGITLHGEPFHAGCVLYSRKRA
jgi:hypothetical protein